MPIANLIKRRRTELKMSQARLAKLAGVSRAAVGQWENGETAPSRRHAPAVAKALQLPVGAIDPVLADGLKPVDRGAHAPTIPLMDFDQFARGADPFSAKEHISIGVPVPDDAIALRVPDDAMAPDFNAQDVVMVAPSVKPATGDVVVAKIERTALLRRFQDRGRDSKGMQVFDLLSTSPDWPTITCNSSNPAKVLGVVVAHTRTLRR